GAAGGTRDRYGAIIGEFVSSHGGPLAGGDLQAFVGEQPVFVDPGFTASSGEDHGGSGGVDPPAFTAAVSPNSRPTVFHGVDDDRPLRDDCVSLEPHVTSDGRQLWYGIDGNPDCRPQLGSLNFRMTPLTATRRADVNLCFARPQSAVVDDILAVVSCAGSHGYKPDEIEHGVLQAGSVGTKNDIEGCFYLFTLDELAVCDVELTIRLRGNVERT